MPGAMSIERINEYGGHAIRIAIGHQAVLLKTGELDALLERLSVIRAAMQPEVPKVPSQTHQYVVEMNPCWHAEKHPLYDGTVLFLRHTGLGWTGFALPTPSLAKLKDALSQHLEASLETQGLPN
ncbi:hypothetical protein [Paraburkholderia phenazinium]|uniref:Uncharacterized protein n=1 Tax=Paraburkholderia phenazinium TaxID=60549 RepID=A0A1N6IEB7_9BURK|nr:hypothetical protein [Paraburkholderia phenazinium]SIO30394.1 hypothetical protein SAMN05444165_2084 [Paraburkholderia phenazinium]